MDITFVSKIETGLEEETFKFLIEDFQFYHNEEFIMADFDVIYYSGKVFIPNNSKIEYLFRLANSFNYEFDQLEKSLRKEFFKTNDVILSKIETQLNQLS